MTKIDYIDEYNKQMKNKGNNETEYIIRDMNALTTQDYAKGIDIIKDVINILIQMGLNEEKKGTKYLAELATYLYYERRGFNRDYPHFNFNNKINSHYIWIRDDYERPLNEIHKDIKDALSDSYASCIEINELLYSVVNAVMEEKNIKEYRLK